MWGYPVLLFKVANPSSFFLKQCLHTFQPMPTPTQCQKETASCRYQDTGMGIGWQGVVPRPKGLPGRLVSQVDARFADAELNGMEQHAKTVEEMH